MEAIPHERVARVTEFLGWAWDENQTLLLARYGEWLVDEGLRLGGIGPAEGGRLWDRHLLDSLLFGWGMAREARLLDVGSGVGLPGIPLAIGQPGSQVSLLERSGRRVDALHRITQILGIDAAIIEGDVDGIVGGYDRLVLRASLPLPEALRRTPVLTAPGGETWFGLGRGLQSPAVAAWEEQPPPVPPGWETELRPVPAGVLDSPAWLLRIGRWR